MSLKSNSAKAIKNFACNWLCGQKRGADRKYRRQAAYGAASMEATALFGNLSGCCSRVKMKRQKENEQQDSRANIAPDREPLIHGEPEHGVEPKQCSFGCQSRMSPG
jgi:hypothetical protein